MNGTTLDRHRQYRQSGPDWHIMGTGDYNNDGKSDILWQNPSGAVAVWEMNGTSVLASRPSSPTPAPPGTRDPGWDRRHTGD